MVPARTWRVHALEMAPKERFELWRQRAAAAGKTSTTSLSALMETFGLEVEEELSTMATKAERKKEQEGTCKMLTTRTTMTGLRPVKGLQRTC